MADVGLANIIKVGAAAAFLVAAVVAKYIVGSAEGIVIGCAVASLSLTGFRDMR